MQASLAGKAGRQVREARPARQAGQAVQAGQGRQGWPYTQACFMSEITLAAFGCHVHSICRRRAARGDCCGIPMASLRVLCSFPSGRAFASQLCGAVWLRCKDLTMKEGRKLVDACPWGDP